MKTDTRQTPLGTMVVWWWRPLAYGMACIAPYLQLELVTESYLFFAQVPD